MTDTCPGKSTREPKPAAPRGKVRKELWQSLDELAASPEFFRQVQREFPAGASVWEDAVGRRRFLQMMGASLALAGITGCVRQPNEKIVPYVRQPEQLIPGRPLFFATSMPQDHGVAIGLLAESHEGRPTKLEGNPEHPSSLGATNAFAQAAVLQLYDPYRSQVVSTRGDVSTWPAFQSALRDALATAGERGRGVRVLTQAVTSPTLLAQLESFLKLYPDARWHQWEPVFRDNAIQGAKLALGRDANTFYRLDRARVILSLDSNFLCEGPQGVRYSRDFANKRRVYNDADLSRLYALEVTPANTGAVADHRIAVAPAEIEAFALHLARELGVQLGDAAPPPKLRDELMAWMVAVAADLKAQGPASLVVVGSEQPAAVHALAHAINATLGGVGSTVVCTDPLHPGQDGELASLAALVNDIKAGQVDVLAILDGNPVYDAPADFDFATLLKQVKFTAHLGLHEDETSAACLWHLPLAHFLESWGDARAYDGTISLTQPLIAPLYEGRTLTELVAALLGKPDVKSYEIVRDYWRGQGGVGDFERRWQTAVHDGLFVGSALELQTLSLAGDFAAQLAERLQHNADGAGQGGDAFTLVLRPDPTVYDGRYANIGWLQELPKPMTKLTWDNALFLSPATATKLNVVDGDVVEIQVGDRVVRAPAFRQPGLSKQVVALHLGYGRTDVSILGKHSGANAYALRTSQQPWTFSAQLTPVAEKYPLAVTQGHQRMEGRDLVRSTNLNGYQKDPEFARNEHEPTEHETLLPIWKYEGHAWGMSIDLNACNGCSACVIACQAENNIPVVGKDQVIAHREMQWLRIDRYYEGDENQPEATYFEPVLCMHCEHAPCELVCPVEATAHSAEGLNDMVYNRCVGTRYCSNNCPYKVRRFNFFQYADYTTPQLKLLNNPDVTVRSRGVMEKCTYCVQRINAGRMQAEIDGRRVRDGDIVTACQQACPAQAIVFGDINDEESKVAELKALPLNYGLLTELNTRPRTTYLGQVKNPNLELLLALEQIGRTA